MLKMQENANKYIKEEQRDIDIQNGLYELLKEFQPIDKVFHRTEKSYKRLSGIIKRNKTIHKKALELKYSQKKTRK